VEKILPPAEPASLDVVAPVVGRNWFARGPDRQGGKRKLKGGTPVSGSGDGPQGDDLEESARKQNSALESLIESLGNLLAASRELLARLQARVQQDQSSGPEDGGRKRNDT